MQNETLEIIYQDAHYVTINKPAGLLVHKSPIDKHETRFALQILHQQLGQKVYPVHRLDKPTSGILLFALSSEACNKAQQLFNEQAISKDYLAVVRGFTPETLTIDHPVKAQADKKYQPEIIAKEGITELQTLDTTELNIAIEKYPRTRYSLVKLSPKTGRRHQLRYHMKHISHPIIGDAKYGKSLHNRFFEQQFNCSRLMLTAVSLSFNHPYNNEPMNFTAKPDQRFLNCCQALGFKQAAIDEIFYAP